MNYLIDTNVLSELRKRAPNQTVMQWMAERPAVTLYLSVLTLGELRKGIETLSESRRKRVLSEWLETDLPAFFGGRILPVDTEVADRWGRMVARSHHPLPAIDSLLAATAMTHRLTLVTPNVHDFQQPDLQIFNPWIG